MGLLLLTTGISDLQMVAALQDLNIQLNNKPCNNKMISSLKFASLQIFIGYDNNFL